VDVVGEWRAYRLWSPDYLASSLKDSQVTTWISEDGPTFGYSSSPVSYGRKFETRQLGLGAALALMEESRAGTTKDHYYVAQQPLPQQLVPDIRLPSWLMPSSVTGTNMWIGGVSVTPLHFDASHNF